MSIYLNLSPFIEETILSIKVGSEVCAWADEAGLGADVEADVSTGVGGGGLAALSSVGYSGGAGAWESVLCLLISLGGDLATSSVLTDPVGKSYLSKSWESIYWLIFNGALIASSANWVAVMGPCPLFYGITIGGTALFGADYSAGDGWYEDLTIFYDSGAFC
jgi:hypothetical protein